MSIDYARKSIVDRETKSATHNRKRHKVIVSPSFCDECDSQMVKVVGRHLGDPKVEVCPTCLYYRMQVIRAAANPSISVKCVYSSAIDNDNER